MCSVFLLHQGYLHLFPQCSFFGWTIYLFNIIRLVQSSINISAFPDTAKWRAYQRFMRGTCDISPAQILCCGTELWKCDLGDKVLSVISQLLTHKPQNQSLSARLTQAQPFHNCCFPLLTHRAEQPCPPSQRGVNAAIRRCGWGSCRKLHTSHVIFQGINPWGTKPAVYVLWMCNWNQKEDVRKNAQHDKLKDSTLNKDIVLIT